MFLARRWEGQETFVQTDSHSSLTFWMYFGSKAGDSCAQWNFTFHRSTPIRLPNSCACPSHHLLSELLSSLWRQSTSQHPRDVRRRQGVIQMLPEAELCWEQTAGWCCVRALVRSHTWGAGVRVDRRAEHHCCLPGSRASPQAGSARSSPAQLPVLAFTWEFGEACWAEGSCRARGREWRVTAQVMRPLAVTAARTSSLDPGEPNLPSSGLLFREPGGLTREGQAAPLYRVSRPEVASW